MQYTHVQTLKVIGGLPPLRLRFSIHKYLISAFSTFQRLLAGLNSTKMVWEFGMVDDYDLEPVRSDCDYPLEALLHVPNANNVLEQKLTSVEKDLYQMVVPRLVALATSRFYSSLIFFTDGSKSEAGTSFGVYHSDIQFLS
jgi:hypothetical protein